jgi:choline dehydrogenase-like flavoprotein
MITDGKKIPQNEPLVCDVCIVGAGAAGIVLALELAKSGMSILLLEAGDLRSNDKNQDSLRGTIANPSNHSPLHESRCRQLGGTTAIWGGRCIPFDGIDFEKRDYVPGSGWPFGLSELEPYYEIANRYCHCGEYRYTVTQALQHAPRHIVEGFVDDLVSDARLERWSLPTNFGKEYLDDLKTPPNLRVILNAICLGIDLSKDGDRVSSLRVCSPRRNLFSVASRAIVLAGGGLETTRLLLASNNVQKSGIGNHSGLLGRYYMGHLSGAISQAKFHGDPDKTIYSFERDHDGVYCRRRFWISENAQKKHSILNTVLWLDNPPMHDPSHQNGVLSLAYLALSTPGLRERLAPVPIVKAAVGGGRGSYEKHLLNVVRDIPSVIHFFPSFLYKRYVPRRRLPGFFLKNRANVYDLHYHAEQCPNFDSRVTLSEERDDCGMQRLHVDFRYNDMDIESVCRAHHLLDQELQKQGCGHLVFKDNDIRGMALRQAGDGVHQIGTTRMAADERAGVVNEHCRVHGLRNLFIASSSVFPTSGQANPTLTIVALAIRLADHLKQNLTTI